MLLVVTATEMEMTAIRASFVDEPGLDFLVAGMGPVETTLNLTRYIAAHGNDLNGVINAGVAGAFVGTGLDVLDICLAEQEIFADLGVCLGDEIGGFDEERLPIKTSFSLRNRLLSLAESLLRENGVDFSTGVFVTLSCASGTVDRGNYLRDKHQAICENMEGAAVARVCEAYDLQCLELRCVSNLVAAREEGGWQLKKASQRGGETVAALLKGLLKEAGK